jgi:hypothetical protein
VSSAAAKHRQDAYAAAHHYYIPASLIKSNALVHCLRAAARINYVKEFVSRVRLNLV